MKTIARCYLLLSFAEFRSAALPIDAMDLHQSRKRRPAERRFERLAATFRQRRATRDVIAALQGVDSAEVVAEAEEILRGLQLC